MLQMPLLLLQRNERVYKEIQSGHNNSDQLANIRKKGKLYVTGPLIYYSLVYLVFAITVTCTHTIDVG